MPGGDPISQRRKLKAELQQARSAAQLTQRDAAQRLDWSESKLIRIENGEVGLAVTDLQAMLRLYQVTNKQTVAELSEAARGSRGSFWWSGYRDVVSAKLALYLGQEASASTIRVFHPFLIPGLLHTEDYAYELLRARRPDEEARRIAEMRKLRQQHLFGQADSAKVVFVFGEEALHRWIGGPGVMQEQLQLLLQACEQVGVTVQVIPFHAGAHPGALGSFILLGFADSPESLLFVEGLSGDLVSRGDQKKIRQFARHFDTLRSKALPPDQTKALIERQLEKFRQAAAGTPGAASKGSLAAAETASQPADAKEDRWRTLAGASASSLRLLRTRTNSLACSPGSLASRTAPLDASPFSASSLSR